MNEINRSVNFFDTQFQRQIGQEEFELNPFEKAALPFVHGSVLDLGCGLGNLSVAAARKGCPVLALDASPSAIESLAMRAEQDRLPIRAERHDLAEYQPNTDFDTVLCIGLLMFFKPAAAYGWLEKLKSSTKPGGIAAVNVLIEGTTYLDMFEPEGYTLFPENLLNETFSAWSIKHSEIQQFDAPLGTVKRFSTVIARKTA